MTAPTMPPSQVGQLVYLGSRLLQGHIYGVLLDGETPDQFSMTMEVVGDQATLITAAIKGDKGDPGENAFALRLQKTIVDEPANLPITLQDNEADLGKYWLFDDLDEDGNIIGSSAWIWFGDSWRRMMMGSPGPPGPVPIITPRFHQIEPEDNTQEPRIVPTGTPFYPVWDIYWKGYRGPQGVAGYLADCPDVTNAIPEIGQTLGWKGNFTPGGLPLIEWMDVGAIIPKPTVIPEAAFTAFQGLSTRATVGTYQLPPLPYNWKPFVWGHINVNGLELDSDPLTIGAEVRMGDPVTGTLVARGFGSSIGQVTLLPHTSTPTTTSVAMTAQNDVAKVLANHSNPALGTLFVNLYNDGIIGVYQFQPKNAQLAVLQIPV